jgi:surface antigen
MRNRVSLVAVSARALCVAICVALAAPAFADPPSHAPAHGWRKKHDPNYVGYTGKEWPRDYGIIAGRCNRDEIGTVLGAVAGGAIGSQIGDGSGRAVAIVVGTVLGAVIGREIGKDLDERDRACVGHALELVKDGGSVRWTNEITRVTYQLKPLGALEAGTNCRKFEIKATLDSKSKTSPGKACRKGDGTWTIMQ